MSDTALVDITYGTGLLLAILGIIVSLWPPQKSLSRSAAVVAFCVLGVIGALCVHQMAVSAEKQQAKAREEQRSLESKIDDVQTEQAASTTELAAVTTELAAVTTELAAVTEQTAPLGTVPLPVEIKNPQALARQIQEPGWRQSGPLRWKPKEVNPSYIDALSAVEVTIQADKELPSATIEVVCDAPILGSPQIEAAGYPTEQLGGLIPTGDRTIRFTIVSPMLSEAQAYKVTLESARQSPPISVTKVHKVQ